MTDNNYEGLGVFYLGKKFDFEGKKLSDDLILYESKDLTTHAVCLGMTGSGKTGLCIVTLEEALIDGIPSIIIDPKGDMTNLLLTFPDLTGKNFEPWINVEDASKNKLPVEEYAIEQANLWKNGLKDWNQDSTRIKRLKDSAQFVIYTPGSNSGIPISIMKSFSVPSKETLNDNEILKENIAGIVSGLLTLIGIEVNPIESREHILLTTIIDHCWKNGQDLDLPSIIQYVQTPPVSKVGVLDLETFFPTKERFSLVMSLNNLLASHSFSAWMEGEPRDIKNILYTKEGKAKASIFYIAHLTDNERMFFVSILLNQILSWVRTQSGTSSLRAILYMDEIFGYFPPVSNPPSKVPLLSLLKQARAFGLGVILATQNPVDLDYRGLSNIGTWFVGRLQTERDKEKVLDGLESVAQTTGKSMDRKTIDNILSGLQNRTFLMSNAHEDGLEIIQSRWALSYLCGPLSRDQIKTLMEPIKKELSLSSPKQQVSIDATNAVDNSKEPSRLALPPQIKPNNINHGRPILASGIPQFFIPISDSLKNADNRSLYYLPYILGGASVNFIDSKSQTDFVREEVYVTPVTDDPIPVEWQKSKKIQAKFSDLQKNPEQSCPFSELPVPATKESNYESWGKDFRVWVSQNSKIELFRDPATQLVSLPNEKDSEFRLRIDQKRREVRDGLVAELRQKYAPKVATIRDRMRKAQHAVDVQASQANEQKMQTALSIGATLLGAFLGKRTIGYSTYRRAGRAIGGVGKTMKEGNDVESAKSTLEHLKNMMENMDFEFKNEVSNIAKKIDSLADLETIVIKPNKANISVKLISLVWVLTSQSIESSAS